MRRSAVWAGAVAVHGLRSRGWGARPEWCQCPGGVVAAALRRCTNNACIKPSLFL